MYKRLDISSLDLLKYVLAQCRGLNPVLIYSHQNKLLPLLSKATRFIDGKS